MLIIHGNYISNPLIMDFNLKINVSNEYFLLKSNTKQFIQGGDKKSFFSN